MPSVQPEVLQSTVGLTSRRFALTRRAVHGMGQAASVGVVPGTGLRLSTGNHNETKPRQQPRPCISRGRHSPCSQNRVLAFYHQPVALAKLLRETSRPRLLSADRVATFLRDAGHFAPKYGFVLTSSGKLDLPESVTPRPFESKRDCPLQQQGACVVELCPYAPVPECRS